MKLDKDAMVVGRYLYSHRTGRPTEQMLVGTYLFGNSVTEIVVGSYFLLEESSGDNGSGGSGEEQQ